MKNKLIDLRWFTPNDFYTLFTNGIIHSRACGYWFHTPRTQRYGLVRYFVLLDIIIAKSVKNVFSNIHEHCSTIQYLEGYIPKLTVDYYDTWIVNLS